MWHHWSMSVHTHVTCAALYENNNPHVDCKHLAASLNEIVEQPSTHRVWDSNVGETFQNYRAELVHDVYHGFVIILGETKSKIKGCDISHQISHLPPHPPHLFCPVPTSDCLMVTKRLRISLRMAMATLRVLSWQEQRSTSASPSTACSTVEWGPRSAGILRVVLACSSCGTSIEIKGKSLYLQLH